MYANGEKEIDVVGVPSDDVFKRPAENDGSTSKKIKLEEEGRATREITSVMMTTSGFISPAREGKLPETKPPKLADEFPKLIPPPMISPSTFKSKDALGSTSSSGMIDKKMEKKLKKKNHDKEKKKDKSHKFSLPDQNELSQYDPPSNPAPPNILPPQIMPREANEQIFMDERKKMLKKLKMKNKEGIKELKKKKEKPPKVPKSHAFEPAFLDNKFDPFQILPTSLPQPPPANSQISQIQAHNYLTGAAHGLFPNPLLDSPLLSVHNPLIEGKLVSEPDKQKLNIFKKISKPKEDPMKQQHPIGLSSQMDFLSPSKLDRFDANQSSASLPQQTFADPIKKMHKLPKETTLTRVDDNLPMNLSGMSKSNESSFEETAMPKTPTIPRTPDFKLTQTAEKKEKKERKKKEKKVDQVDWSQQQQQQQFPNPFENNPFLQSLQSGGIMGNLGNPFMSNRNPFSLPPADLFSSTVPSLIPRNSFNMSQPMNPYGFPALEMNNVIPKQKKVKQPKPTMDDFLQMGSKFCNVAPLVPPSIIKERFDPQSMMNLDPFPLQQQTMSSAFDQLLKDQQQPHQKQSSATTKKINDEKMETFDLTKDSSPEPVMNVPIPAASAPAPSTAISQAPSLSLSFQSQQSEVLPTILEQTKEKSKEKKKKKDKDKERDKDKEERKKVKIIFLFLVSEELNVFIIEKEREEKEEGKT